MTSTARKNRFLPAFALGLLLLTLGREATGEQRPQTNHPNVFIGQAQSIPFTDGGAALLPDLVIAAMLQGELSDSMVFLLLNQVMTSCVESAMRYVPHQRHSYKTAQALYQIGLCQLFSCMKQGILLGFAANAGPGGQQGALAMAESMKEKGGCRGSSPAVDPKLVQMLAAGGGGNN